MIDRNTMDLLEEYLKIREKCAIDRELSKEISLRKILLIGILQTLILSKKIFKKNKDIDIFLKNNFGISLSKYMLHSRTMICGKIIRIVNEISDVDEINGYMNKLYEILRKINTDKELSKMDIYDVIKEIEL